MQLLAIQLEVSWILLLLSRQRLRFVTESLVTADCEQQRTVHFSGTGISRKITIYITWAHGKFFRKRKESIYWILLSEGPYGATRID